MILALILGVYYLSNKGNILNSIYILYIPYSILGLFLVMGNMLGVLPFAEAPGSQISIALGLAGLTMGSIFIKRLFYEKYKIVLNFMPSGNIYLIILLVILEIIAYISRGLSLGLRLFINLAAGKFMSHLILEIVGNNFYSLTGIGLFLAFEMMVAYLQYFIFCYILKIS